MRAATVSPPAPCLSDRTPRDMMGCDSRGRNTMYATRLATGLMFAALVASATTALADDILEAMDLARKAYQSGDLTGAKQNLDLASQLVGQKNAEQFSKFLPNALPGWKAEKAQTSAMGMVAFGASVANRTYTNAKGDTVEVQITGDSAMVMQFATLLQNPAIAGAMGKLIRVGSQRAVQTGDGDVNMVIANKFLVTVQGSADAASKLAYAQAVDVARLAKM
jgi:hypothetical protein